MDYSKMDEPTSEEREELERLREEHNNNQNNNSKLIIILLIVIIIVGGIIAIILLTRNNNSSLISTEQDIYLESNELEYSETGSYKIDYQVPDGLKKKNVSISFSSSDPKVATVDNSGNVYIFKNGNAVITMTYIVDGVTKTKTINVSVGTKKEESNKTNNDKNKNNNNNNKPSSGTTTSSDKTAPSITYSLVNGSESSWNKEDVSIKVNATDTSTFTLSYSINSGAYVTITSGSTIKVSTDGTNKVVVRAVDKYNNESSKQINIRIDKTAPTCSMSISGTKVTVTNTENGSGLAYYGWNSDYSGSNTNTKDVTKEETIKYYVKDNVGNTGECSKKVTCESWEVKQTGSQWSTSSTNACVGGKCTPKSHFDSCTCKSSQTKVENGETKNLILTFRYTCKSYKLS